MTRDICITQVTGQPCYACVLPTPSQGDTVTVTVVSLVARCSWLGWNVLTGATIADVSTQRNVQQPDGDVPTL